MITGNLDTLTQSAILGWIANKTSPNKPIKLVLLINNQVVDYITADIFRPDVKKALGTGHHGFYATLDGKLKAGNNLIKLIIENTEEAFAERTIFVSTQQESKVERGINGWLFLINDSNKSVEAISGETRLTDSQLNAYERLFYVRELLSKEHGFKLANYIIPDKGVICNKYRTPQICISESRPVVEILKRTQRLATVKYPIELASSRENFYFKTDTHPSYEGQKAIFDMILNDLGIAPTYDISLEEEALSGDLGSKLTPQEFETVLKPRPIFSPHSVIDTAVEAFQRGERLTGTWTKYTGNSGLAKRVLLIGTSTAFYLREFFFSQFRDVIYCWHTALDLDTIIEFQPDYVITLLTERFLVQIPNDNETKYNIF